MVAYEYKVDPGGLSFKRELQIIIADIGLQHVLAKNTSNNDFASGRDT